jgi:endonuclease G, mitochondrial
VNLRHWFRGAAIVVSIAVYPAAVFAEQPFAGCRDEFWAGQPPVAVGRSVADALCATHFATLYSGQTETPLYSAEHLTPNQIQAAIHRRRVDEFHEDGRLPAAVASTLEDYRRSGYDRGHMAPNGDMPDAKSQWQSFALSNFASEPTFNAD